VRKWREWRVEKKEGTDTEIAAVMLSVPAAYM